jgi:rhamnose utilization protein RhaD (predicted bifunctional aldolase and dehydrogenase)
MVISNYTYLKLKMSGLAGIITIGPTYRHAYECDVECVEYAKALVESKAFITDFENLTREVPDPKKHSDNFELAEAMKTFLIDPSASNKKVLQIGSRLEPK